MVGTFLFLGIISTLILTSWISDKYGRRLISLLAQVVAIAASIALLMMSWIWGLYVGMYLIGTVWACENIVLVNWHLEFVPQKQRRTFLFLRLVLIASNVILTTALI